MTAKIKLNAASGGGSISIQAPSSSSNNRVISLPDIADGTLLTSQSSLDSTKLSPAITEGKVLQQKFVKKTNTTSTSSNSIVETSSDFRTTITPISASSTIFVQAFLAVAMNASDIATFRLARNTASDFSGTTTEFLTPDTYSTDQHGNLLYWNSAGFMDTIPLVAYETSGNTTARTYSPFWLTNAGTLYLNQYTSTTYTMTSVMTVTEIAA